MTFCKQCSTEFTVTEKDLLFYQKMSPVFGTEISLLPPPSLCPACREKRRLSFRNERHLYKRKSDLSGKPIVSTYRPEKPYKICSPEEWWSDAWNGLDYGRDFDFSRPFFDQFDELWKVVPQMALLNTNNQNAEYATFSVEDKNCYLIFASNRNEDCYYSSYIWDSKNCMDCLNVERCQTSYMCVDCINCYQSFFTQNSQDSYNLSYCYDCRNCHDCFACSGLRKQSFCILNKNYSEAEYKKILSDPVALQKILNEFGVLKQSTPRLFANLTLCEEVTGSNLRSCRHANHAFDSFECEDVSWVENCPGKVKDGYDISGSTHSELVYELVSVAFGYRLFACLYTHTNLSDSFYCVACPGSSHLFGCIGLKKQSYCIFNKPYSKEAYEALVPRIIEHMRATGEWGEFFPAALSPYDYEETCAQEHYPRPLTSSVPPPVIYVPEASPCETCKKFYKTIPQEEQFYKEMNIPKPPVCPDCRHKLRFKERLPKKLWERTCKNCGLKLKSPYEPSRPEPVYCEKCYLAAIY